MDPDEVSKLVREMKLSSEAGELMVEINLPTNSPTVGANMKRYVVGKIFASRVVNRENLRTQLPRILQTRGDLDIEIVGDNLFILVFTNDRDRRHALFDGPWHFFDNLMLFKEPKGLEKPTDIIFSEFTTWIQIHNLPIACMNPSVIRQIAEAVGTVEEIDTGDGGNCLGQYARALVTRDVNLPLQRCVSICAGTDNEAQIVLIRYERLPEFCNACGRLGHIVRHCMDPSVDKQKRPFGVWLKATRTVESRRGRGGNIPREAPGLAEVSSSSQPASRALVVAEESPLASNATFAAGASRDETSTEYVLEPMGIEDEIVVAEPQAGAHTILKHVPDATNMNKIIDIPMTTQGPVRAASPIKKTTPFRAKNILLAALSPKKSREGWKRRARAIGNKKQEKTKTTLLGDKRKVDDGKSAERQGDAKRSLSFLKGNNEDGTLSTSVLISAEAASQPRRSL